MPSLEPLTTSTLQFGEGLTELLDELQSLVGIFIEGDVDADVGMRLGDDVGKELVEARALGLQPDHFESEEDRLQRIARRVARIDDR